MTTPIADVLAEIATQPPDAWDALLRKRFPDAPSLVQQGLLWLRADRERVADAESPPSLGDGDARYQLGVMLDAGATASVWQAYDRTLGRNVAIKVFGADRVGRARRHSLSRGGVDDILAEARAACEVTSDHVVRVLDVHDDDAHPYIVMELIGEHDPLRGELVPGRSAAACRPENLDEAVRWVIEAARGLHDAHLRNVFHRDLKPHNVLITPLSRRARIADFGLAVSADRGERAGTTGLIRRGPNGAVRVAGTPEYMAPEQARGLPIVLSARDVSERTTLVRVDVWGLGALAYDLLGGRSPWTRGADGDEAWEVASSGARPPPITRTPTGERIPMRLQQIVERALAFDPAARYATAAEVGNELQAFLDRRPTSFDRARHRRLALWSRRNPQLTLTALVAVGLGAATLAAYAPITHLRDQREALATENAQQEADNQQLAARAAKARALVGETEEGLAKQAAALAMLERAVGEGQREVQAITEAKEHALHDASEATRKLVDALAIARSERQVAEYSRSLYEGFWTTARTDAEASTKALEQALKERDVARAERDQSGDGTRCGGRGAAARRRRIARRCARSRITR